MSKYTTQIRHICDSLANLTESGGYLDTKTTIEKARTKIFNFEYPIFDDKYKKVLETKILKRYYTREIGEETYGLWKLRLDTRLNEIMPYYNKLYESELLKFDPFKDVDLTTERESVRDGKNITTGSRNEDSIEDRNFTGDTTASGKDNVISTNNNLTTTDDSGNVTTNSTGTKDTTTTDDRNDWDLHSDTPQGSISRMLDSNNMYLTDAKNMIRDGSIVTDEDTTDKSTVVSSGNSTTDQTLNSNIDSTRNDSVNTVNNEDVTKNNKTTYNDNTDINSTETYLEHIYGKRGSNTYMNLLLEYRKTFLNIDMMILDDLSDLFIMLW